MSSQVGDRFLFTCLLDDDDDVLHHLADVIIFIIIMQRLMRNISVIRMTHRRRKGSPKVCSIC